MRHFSLALITTTILLMSAGSSTAHFGMLIPAEPIVTPENRSIELKLSFSHPFEEIGMDLVKP